MYDDSTHLMLMRSDRTERQRRTGEHVRAQRLAHQRRRDRRVGRSSRLVRLTLG